MKIIGIAVAVLAMVAGIVAYRAVHADSKAPAVGTAAPDFTLNSQEGQAVSLHDFKGKWVVLYFYPKDFTSGCTVEAHNFQTDLPKYEAKNAVIVGVSVQDEASHKSFCTKESLTFRLLADTNKDVSKTYDSVIPVAQLSARHTFLIDPSGTVRKVYLDVDVKKHSEEVLAALDEMQKSGASK
jgi:peroxiredoxin Q/BCP